MSSLKLTNPHSVLAVFDTRPLDVLELYASPRHGNDAWRAALDAAGERGIPIRESLAHADGGRRRSQEGGRIGTTYALVRERTGVSLEELFSAPDSRGLWLALDQLQDPHNVGAVFRTAAFFGIKGIVLTVDRSAPLSSTVYDVASGGLEYVPFTLQTNLAQGIEIAKQCNLWVLGSSERADESVYQIDRDRRWLLVIGNEEKGLRRLTLERCDQLCRIPSAGTVDSLNVSVAAGILMAALTATP